MQRAYRQDTWAAIARLDLLPDRWRPALLRKAGFDVPDSVLIMSGLRVVRSGALTIGERSFINYDCYLDVQASISIGACVQIADHVRVVTSTHEFGPATNRAGDGVCRPVVIGDGCWIGSGVTVLPGVTVDAGCVLAAGAVVATDCSPNGLYAGVPATRKRDLPPTR